jgi:uncharacterized protein (DUF1015 family)
MPVMEHPDTTGLDLAPFRGLRYDPARVGDLASVTSPPYDVVEPEGVPALEEADPRNIVRLVLPRDGASGPESRYAHAGATLRAWLDEGVLRPDPDPAIYVYEQRTAVTTQRGLIGALALDDPARPTVLPHEDVMPRVVADRTELMASLWANPEPILLAYSGDGPASDALDRAASGHPLLHVRTEDGVAHRLWAITDPGEIALVRRDLGARRAMIADGHHRWAGYRHLRGRAHAAGLGAGPWDRGLVLLVDTVRHPLQVGAIHRVLPRLTGRAALDLLSCHGPPGAGAFLARPLDEALPAALWSLERTAGPAFLLAGAGMFHILSGPDPELLERAIPRDRPEAWRNLDATVLHHALFAHVWEIPDDPEHIVYAHDTLTAVRDAHRTGGSAILMRPTTEAVVRELAQQGVRMPRKSTSFGPKPVTGLVLRGLDPGP